MLVLTHRDHETIRSEDGQVRLGLEAPADIPIDREDIFHIKQAKLLAKEQEEKK